MTTPPHKTHPHTLVRVLMFTWIKRNWWWIAAPPVIALIVSAALHDLRFVLVALIWVFLVAPPVMIMVYFYHALSPEARYSIRWHTISITPDGIMINYPEESKEDAQDTSCPELPDDIIPRKRITSVKHLPQYTLLTLDDNPYKVIIIPSSIWDTPAAASAFRGYLKALHR